MKEITTGGFWPFSASVGPQRAPGPAEANPGREIDIEGGVEGLQGLPGPPDPCVVKKKYDRRSSAVFAKQVPGKVSGPLGVDVANK